MMTFSSVAWIQSDGAWTGGQSRLDVSLWLGAIEKKQEVKSHGMAGLGDVVCLRFFSWCRSSGNYWHPFPLDYLWSL